MRKYTLEQYREMVRMFNKLSFKEKIENIIRNKDILTLISDHNWWGVKAKDKQIQADLEFINETFQIIQEWDSDEMNTLVYLLGIDNTDI